MGLSDYEIMKFHGELFEKMLAGDIFDFTYVGGTVDQMRERMMAINRVAMKYGGRPYEFKVAAKEDDDYFSVVASPAIPDDES